MFSKEAGKSNVMYMIWIFILAGVFAAIAKKIGAVEATVDVTLSFLPVQLIVPGLFVATCFISMAIGTCWHGRCHDSFAVDMASSIGSSVPFLWLSFLVVLFR